MSRKIDWAARRAAIDQEINSFRSKNSKTELPKIKSPPHISKTTTKKTGKLPAVIGMVLALGLITGMFFLGLTHLTGFATIQTLTEGDFDNGTYNQTFYNVTGNFIQLNVSEGFAQGNYTSNISDAGQEATWVNISWTSQAFGELSNFRLNETSPQVFGKGSLDMTGNVVLFHFNNDSAFGENNSLAYDFSGTHNNGTIENGADIAGSGWLGGGSYRSDGSDGNSINVTDSPLIDIDGTTFTFASWVRLNFPVTTSDTHFLYDKTDGNSAGFRTFYAPSTDVWRFRTFTSEGSNCDANVPGAIPTWIVNSWHHIATIYDGSNTLIYWDGKLATSCSEGGNLLSANANLVIGANHQAEASLSGRFDEVAIFNRSLSAAEIRDMYIRGITRLNLSVRSCDDEDCAGENFIHLDNQTSPQTLSLDDNRYFQYFVDFNSSVEGYTPALFNVTLDYTITATDTEFPNVTNATPAPGSIFNITAILEIGVNASDGIALSNVFANITYPNRSTILYNLTNRTTHINKFNTTIPADLAGYYTIVFIANDSSDNKNQTEGTHFYVDSNFTFLNLTLSPNNFRAGWAGGNLSPHLYFNHSANALQLNDSPINGTYSSQIFNLGEEGGWINISWSSNAYGEFANLQLDETAEEGIWASGNIDMSENVLLFHFNNDSTFENSTNVYDWSNGATNGTWVTGTSNGTPHLGVYSAEFSGDNVAINLSPSADLNMSGNFTVSMWVRWDNTTAPTGSNLPTLIIKELGWSIYMSDDTTITVAGDGETSYSSTCASVTPGSWHHVLAIYNGSTGHTYCDGVFKASGTINAVQDGVVNVYIGGQPNYAFGGMWDGNIDELAIWNRTITPQEIKDIYARGATRLNLSVRSCDDAACSGETFEYTNSSGPTVNLDVIANNFFQYNFSFETFNNTVTPSLYNVTIEYNYTPTVISDNDFPNVTNATPAPGSIFNITAILEIGVNASDGIALSNVFANITYPNRSTILYNLTNRTTHINKFNTTIPADLAGYYTIVFIANDSSDNKNQTTGTHFYVDSNFTFLNLTLSPNNFRAGWAGGNLSPHLFFNHSANALQLNDSPINGTYSSQIFNLGEEGGWINISWSSNAYGEFANNQTDETANEGIWAGGNLNLSDMVLLYHFNNDSTYENTTHVYDWSSGRSNGTWVAGSSNGTSYLGAFSGEFSGDNIAVNISPSPNLNLSGNFTVSMWFRWDNTTAPSGSALPAIIIKELGWSIYMQADNTITVAGDGETSYNSLCKSATSGVWQNLVVLFNGSTAYTYCDGIFKASGTINAIQDGTVNLYVGGQPNYAFASMWDGNIDELAIWNRTIAPQEIKDVYTRGATRLNLSVRSCDDVACSGETFEYTNSSGPTVNLDVIANNFFQYNFSFETFNNTVTPSLYNVTIEYNITPTEVFNTPPTAPLTLDPANESTTTNRSPQFVWQNSTDVDGDIFSYHLEVDDDPLFLNPEINISSIAVDSGKPNTTFYPTDILDVDTTYFWRVRANDSGGYGNWSNYNNLTQNRSNFTVDSFLALTLFVDIIDFGELGLGVVANTTDGVPTPMRIENTGNIFGNVSINASAFFSSVAHPSSNYQFKVRENESGSFDTALSQTDWINMPLLRSANHTVNLDWQTANNDFLLDLNITVPEDEPSGPKASNVTFTIEGG